MRFRFTETPGHGYLHVSMSMLQELGIDDKITPYSYMNSKGTMAYLEEDVDAGTFIDAYTVAYGQAPELKYVYSHKRPSNIDYRRPGGTAVFRIYFLETGDLIAEESHYETAGAIIEKAASEKWGGKYTVVRNRGNIVVSNPDGTEHIAVDTIMTYQD